MSNLSSRYSNPSPFVLEKLPSGVVIFFGISEDTQYTCALAYKNAEKMQTVTLGRQAQSSTTEVKHVFYLSCAENKKCRE